MQTFSKIIISGLLLAASCKPNYQEASQAEEHPPLVQVEMVTKSEAPLPISVSGVLAAKSETNLSFKVGGIIERLFVDEGQTVRKGQLLARLQLAEINAQVTQAQQASEKATRDLERIQNLYRDSVATLEQLQDLQTVKQVAQADLRIAQFNRQYAEIRAPFDGKIQRRHVESGELVNPGNPIFQVGNQGSSSVVMRIGVADRDVVRLNLGDSAVVKFDAYVGRHFKATVTELAQAANPGTGTFEVELTVEAPTGILRSGFIGKASIYPSNQSPYYKVSMDALVEGDEQNASIFIYNQETETATLVTVEPEIIADRYFTVEASEYELKQIITAGAHYLKNGQKVRLTVNP